MQSCCGESTWKSQSKPTEGTDAVLPTERFPYLVLLSTDNVVNDVVSIFGGSFYVAFLSNLISAAVAALNIIEKLLIIGLGVKALTQGTIAVPVVDNLINKYMG